MPHVNAPRVAAHWSGDGRLLKIGPLLPSGWQLPLIDCTPIAISTLVM